MVDDDPVLLEVKGGVAVVSLNRPDQHNMVGDAADALFFRYLDLLRNDRDVRAVVWRGNGPSFSSGRDPGELHDHPGATHLEFVERNQWQTRLLYDFPVPIICALKGWVLGIQLERALLCDMRVAGESVAPLIDVAWRWSEKYGVRLVESYDFRQAQNRLRVTFRRYSPDHVWVFGVNQRGGEAPEFQISFEPTLGGPRPGDLSSFNDEPSLDPWGAFP